MLPVNQTSRAYTSLTSAVNGAEKYAHCVTLPLPLALIPLTYAKKTQTLPMISVYWWVGACSRGDQILELSCCTLSLDSPHVTFMPPQSSHQKIRYTLQENLTFVNRTFVRREVT